jgi:predicted metal-dependent peptidase
MRIKDMPASARLTRARSALVTNPAYAFFGTLALSLKIEESARTETMTTDGRTLFYAPAFVESLSEGELIGVLAHEVYHLARLHHVRRTGRDLETWNQACDLTINPDLIAQGLQLPKDGLLSPEFAGQGAEQVFSELMRRKPKPQDGNGSSGKPQGGDSGQGKGKDKPDPNGAPQGGSQAGSDCSGPPCPDPGRCGGILDAPADAGTMAEQAAEMETRVRQAVSIAKAANAGTLPGFLKRLVDDLNAPRISWRDVLAEFIDDAATRAVSWNRPNKRFLDSGFFMPGTVADSVGSIAVLVDTSGSVDDKTLTAFASEVQGLLDSDRVERVHVVYCDSKVQGAHEFDRGDMVRLEAKGGGGTRFDVAFAHVESHCPDVAAIVYLTDLDCRHFGNPPAAPVLWAVHGTRRAAPFGRVLPVDPYA